MKHNTPRHLYWYRGADKFLARPGRKQARNHVRDARDFNNIETRAVIKFLFLLGKAQKEIHAILAETLACLLPGRAKDLSTPLYRLNQKTWALIFTVSCFGYFFPTFILKVTELCGFHPVVYTYQIWKPHNSNSELVKLTPSTDTRSGKSRC